MKLLKLNIQMFADGKVVIDTDLNNDGFSKGLDKMKSIAKTGFSAVGAAAGVVATALTAAVGAGVKSYADLEQNIGGVETLFKESADKVIKNAEKAYQTAGVSANQYMEQVTSFSASLLQSLGGDTEKAADYADRAIVDMADNANKMGTSMEMIQNAYQGFAKQNYTMLDNLKLGYGGTKTEMERLISDAAKMTDIQKELNVTVDEGDMSFGNIVNAISVMQKSMGIAGTTSQEAADTISGSFNAAKAAFDNFLNGSGDIDQFVNALMTALGNIGKAVGELAPSIMEGIGSLVEQLIPYIPEALNSLLPVLIESVVTIINSLAEALPAFLTMIQENAQTFIDAALLIITTLVTALLQNLPQLIQTGIQVLLALIQGITQQLPTLIPLMVQVIMDMVNTLLDNIDEIIEAGIQLLVALAEGLMNALPELIARLPEIIIKIVSKLIELAPQLLSAALRIILALAEGLIKYVPEMISRIPQILKSIVNAFISGVKDFIDIGKNLVKGLWQGISDTVSWVLDKIKGFGKSILNGIKKIFGIKSPSKVMRDQVGKYLAEGVGVGFEDAIDDVYKDMQKTIDIETDKMSANVQTSGVYQVAMAGTPTFDLLDNSSNKTQLVVNGKILAEVVNTENRHREVAKA